MNPPISQWQILNSLLYLVLFDFRALRFMFSIVTLSSNVILLNSRDFSNNTLLFVTIQSKKEDIYHLLCEY